MALVGAAAACLFLLVPAEPASGAAWTLGEDEVLLILKSGYSGADSRFDADGDTQDDVSFTAWDSQLYGELGLRNWATLTAELAFKSYDYEDSFSATTEAGFEPIALSTRIRLWAENGHVVSVQPGVRFKAGLDGGGDVQAGGQGSDFEMRALYGWGGSIGGVQGFVNVEGAYRWRSDAEPDEARLDLTLGADIDPDWQVLVQSFTVVAPDEGTASFPDYRQYKGQLSAVYRLDEAMSVQAGVTATLAGENTLEELGGFIALWWRFSL
ncbi:MAG: hypothetical protein GC199_03525 [Alphaproteobacteria bacterium]|nr:hypothetical protein [Alphaproteobacteria bacterium]